MIFFSNNLCYIKFFSEMYYHVFSTKADQKGGSIHKEKNLSTEIHILETLSDSCWSTMNAKNLIFTNT